MKATVSRTTAHLHCGLVLLLTAALTSWTHAELIQFVFQEASPDLRWLPQNKLVTDTEHPGVAAAHSAWGGVSVAGMPYAGTPTEPRYLTGSRLDGSGLPASIYFAQGSGAPQLVFDRLDLKLIQWSMQGAWVRTPRGGSVTVWGSELLFPLHAYGVRLTKIAAGSGHNLGLTTDGRVVGWGWDGEGLIAAGRKRVFLCEGASGLRDVVSFAAGTYHNLVLKSDGTLVNWGYFCGGHDLPDIPATVPTGLRKVVSIAAGPDHFLAVQDDGTVVAWGFNEGACDVPSGLNGVIAVAGGWDHSLALKADGTVAAWGRLWSGQPTTVPLGLNDVMAIAAGSGYSSVSLALKRDGTVVAWDDNSYGQCNLPPGLGGVGAIAAGGSHCLGLKSDGTVVAWGNNDNGQCDVPPGLNEVVAIAAGGGHSLALRQDGATVGWGAHDAGQTTSVSGLDGIAAVSASSFGTTLALKSDGTVVNWGYDYYGRMPAGLTDVATVSAGLTHSLALKTDRTIIAWGDNRWGQCDVPAGLNDAVAVSAASGTSYALRSDGTVAAWGDNERGQCDMARTWTQVVALSADIDLLALKADGTVLSTVPDLPGGLGGVVAVAAGYTHDLALKADGRVVAWGWDYEGQCDVPPDLGDVIAIAAGFSHSLALKSDGTVVGWGQAPPGFPFSSLEGLPPVTAIAAGDGWSLALIDGVNRPPLADTYQLKTFRNWRKAVSLFDLHRVCSDPDWDSFIVSAVSPSSAAGGDAQINGSAVLYTPPKDFVGADSFTYTVRDCRGAASQGTVSVTVLDAKPPLGDLNNDGCVDRGDLTLLMSQVQARSKNLTYDLNGDGKVDIADARFLALHFTNRDGSACPP